MSDSCVFFSIEAFNGCFDKQHPYILYLCVCVCVYSQQCVWECKEKEKQSVWERANPIEHLLTQWFPLRLESSMHIYVFPVCDNSGYLHTSENSQ